jgi:hypothetical protein
MIKGRKFNDRVAEATMSEIRRIERIQDFGYTPYTGTKNDSINPVGYNYMIEDSFYQWLKNPMANNIIEILLDFTLGDGITYAAEDEDVQKVLDEFWNDPDNNWDIMQYSRFRDLYLYGELLLDQTISKFTQKIKVYSRYPGIISGLKRGKNPEKISEVQIQEKKGDEPVWKKIIYINEITGYFEGDVFFFQINKSTHQTRGVTDLMVSRDWLRMYDKSLYATMERVGLLLSFVYDITVKGAKEEDLFKKLKAIQKSPPQPGGVRVHNDSEEWNDITPNLQGRSYEDMYRLFKSQIVAGSRQPEHFFGMGGNVNYATALSMNAPFYRKVKRRQKYIKYIINNIFDYVISKSVESGELSKNNNLEYSVIIPEPDQEVANKVADTIVKFSQSLTMLETNGYIDTHTAQSVIEMLINVMGIEVTNEDEGKDKELDKLAERVKRDMEKSNRPQTVEEEEDGREKDTV